MPKLECGCDIGPGKFEGEGAVSFMVWEQAMLGNSDVSTEDEYGRMVDWLRSPLNLGTDQEVVEAALGYGYCADCVESAGRDIGGGVAVWEDGQGFVYCTTFDTREEFDKALAEAEENQPEDSERGV